MYQDEHIQEICISQGIKILPKRIFNKVSGEFNKLHRIAPYVLIDNDLLMHALWRKEAMKNGLSIDCFESVDHFLKINYQYSKSTIIYIDSELDNELRGEIESEKIYRAGFTELYLATGFNLEDIEVPLWIKSVVGKRPCFIQND